MIDVALFNLVPIVVALLIGIVVGWWMFRRVRITRDAAAASARPHVRASAAPSPSSVRAEVAEGNGLAESAAAAAADVIGDLVGADVHEALPGASGPPDDLQMLKGVGPKLAVKLNELGIRRFDQLAALSPDQVSALDARLDAFKGRVARDRLVEQASYLARGDVAGFQARFGNLGGGAGPVG